MYRTAGAPHAGPRGGPPEPDAAPSPGARAGRALAFVRGPRSPVAAYVSPRRPSLPRRPRPRGRACGLRPPAARVLMRVPGPAGLRPRSGSRTARRGRTRVTYRATGRYRAPPGPGKGRGARRRRPHGGRLLAFRLRVFIRRSMTTSSTLVPNAAMPRGATAEFCALRPGTSYGPLALRGPRARLLTFISIHSRPAPARRAPRHTARTAAARTGGPSAIHAEPRATRYPSSQRPTCLHGTPRAFHRA